jgi:hypothetical protein
VLFIAAITLSDQCCAQSNNTSVVVNKLSFNLNRLEVSKEIFNALDYKKKKSKLLSIADFTLEPNTVFLCCTRGSYCFYFKF